MRLGRYIIVFVLGILHGLPKVDLSDLAYTFGHLTGSGIGMLIVSLIIGGIIFGIVQMFNRKKESIDDHVLDAEDLGQPQIEKDWVISLGKYVLNTGIVLFMLMTLANIG